MSAEAARLVPAFQAPRAASATGLAVAVIALLGLVGRVVLAFDLYPWLGDPVYAYAYRAFLLSRGEMAGAFLTWHPPGYPLVLGALTWLGGGTLSPYVWGTLLNLVSSLGLVLVVDRLLANRVRWPATRLVAASFLAFYEGVYLWATGPLTEPFYLLLVFGAVALADRPVLGFRRSVVIGALLGVACATRLEGLAAFAGLSLWLVFQASSSSEQRLASTIKVAAGLAFGWLVGFGWLLPHLDYLGRCVKSQEWSYTFPPVSGVRANLVRLMRCEYHAWTNWLPQVLLLPYWLLVPLGLLARPREGNAGARLQGLLLAVVLPCLLAVSTSIMHKRTGTFLLPAVAVWLAFAAEELIARFRGNQRTWVVAAVVWGMVSLNVLLGARYWLAREGPTRGPSTLVIGQELKASQVEPGPVWAFGAEPELYYFWGQPIVFPVLDQTVLHERVYGAHRGNPAGFIDELRRQGYRYLIFRVEGSVSTGSSVGAVESATVKQAYGSDPPLRADLEALIGSPGRYHLEPLFQVEADAGTSAIHAFVILPR
jgi:hypothetical protein